MNVPYSPMKQVAECKQLSRCYFAKRTLGGVQSPTQCETGFRRLLAAERRCLPLDFSITPCNSMQLFKWLSVRWCEISDLWEADWIFGLWFSSVAYDFLSVFVFCDFLFVFITSFYGLVLWCCVCLYWRSIWSVSNWDWFEFVKLDLKIDWITQIFRPNITVIRVLFFFFFHQINVRGYKI